MKTRSIYIVGVLIVLFVLAFGWKLNDYYQSEKISQQQEKIHQQTLSLKTPVSTQLSQLKNILSSYAFKLNESQINWVQLEPFIALAQVKLGPSNQFEVKNFFSKTGTKADRWTKDFLQKGLVPLKKNKRSGQATTVAKLFQTRDGEKFVTLVFLDTPDAGADGVAVISDVAYFQKFFDLQRSRKMTHVLMTDEDVVAAHSEPEYIASITAESNLNPEKFFIDAEEIRSTNLKIISYAPKSLTVSKISMPPSLLGLLFGFMLVLLGGLYYLFRPVEKIIAHQKKKQKEEAFQKAVESQTSNQVDLQSRPSADLQLRQEVMAQVFSEVKEAKTPMVLIPIEEPVVKEKETSAPEWGDLFVPPVQPEFPLQTLNEPLKNAIDLLRPHFEDNSIRLQSDLLSHIEFRNDPARLQKMFENILRNALEAVKGRQIKIVSVRSYDAADTAVVEIQDSGGGVAPENIEKIWQPFFTTKPKEQHKGLGLSESMSVARRFGGELQVSNHPQGGVLVKIIMPGGLVAGLTKNEVQVADSGSHHEKNLAAVQDSQLHELDIDAILSLDSFDISTDDISEVPTERKTIAQELAPTHFKIDTRLEIEEDPKIQFNKPSYSVDEFAVQIRKPEKS